VIRGVVFDIDDTLYLERDYVRSGFDHVAQLVRPSQDERDEIASSLWQAFLDGTRGDTFDRLLRERPRLADVQVADLVRAYRHHEPAITLAPEVPQVVEHLQRRGLRLGVLSDGPIDSQRAKARALGLDRWFKPVLLTEDRGTAFHKPADLGFREIGAIWALPPESLAYVADNPRKDFAGPNRLGWATIRLRFPGQLRYAVEPASLAETPDEEIASLQELLAILEGPR
jgi:putative hydrolase of the HAD superfamily